MTIAVYPGSFDPITNGHLDVIAPGGRRLRPGDRRRPRQSPEAAAPVDGRTGRRHPRRARERRPRVAGRVDVETFDGLTVDFCRRAGAGLIVRGLRAISDFETEIQLAHNNRDLAPDVDTVFFMTSLEHGYVSSSLVKEIATFGGDVAAMVPPAAGAALRGGSIAADPGRGARGGCDNRRRPARHRRRSPARRAGPIDIIFLVERLESIIANGKKLPLTNNVVVDQAAALDLIDELRVAVPEEVRAAKRINSEGERIIEKAQEEAERIVARAQEQAAFLIDERGLTPAAEDESRRIIGEAEGEATTSGAAPTSTPQRPHGPRGRRRQDAPEHQEGHRPPGRAAGGSPGADEGPRRRRRRRRGRRRRGRRAEPGRRRERPAPDGRDPGRRPRRR